MKIPVAIIDVYTVNQGDDDIRSGSPKWVFSKEYEARQYAKKKGWYGGDAPVIPYKAIIIHGLVYLLDNPCYGFILDNPEIQTREDLKRSALAKLSKQEKEVLGLS